MISEKKLDFRECVWRKAAGGNVPFSCTARSLQLFPADKNKSSFLETLT